MQTRPQGSLVISEALHTCYFMVPKLDSAGKHSYNLQKLQIFQLLMNSAQTYALTIQTWQTSQQAFWTCQST